MAADHPAAAPPVRARPVPAAPPAPPAGDLAVGHADAAELAAEGAAAAAGTTVREVHDLVDLAAVAHLLAAVWGRDATPPLTTELLRAFAKAGNYVGGAFDGDQLVGASVGFFGDPSAGALHSHITGVAAAGLGRGVGFALKQHQRAWALRRGVRVIAWTFDPLVRRNAHFNIVKLAAAPVDYLPDFYGTMADRINGGDATDRLLIRWDLVGDAVVQASAGRPRRGAAAAERAAGAVDAVGVDADGVPRQGRLDAPRSLVAVPPDIEQLRVRDPRAAQRWRVVVREALVALLDGGARITGFDPAGWYIVQHPDREDVR